MHNRELNKSHETPTATCATESRVPETEPTACSSPAPLHKNSPDHHRNYLCAPKPAPSSPSDRKSNSPPKTQTILAPQEPCRIQFPPEPEKKTQVFCIKPYKVHRD